MRVYVVTEKEVRCGIMMVLMIVAITIGLPRLPAVRRWRHGAPKGVTLAGQPVGGLLPQEVRALVTKLAEQYRREPHNAGYFEETGELIPEQNGLAVDIEGTIKKIFSTKEGEQVQPVTYVVTAARDRSYYLPVYEGNADRQEVSITFNVAWGEEEIPQILAILKETGVKATFYFVGTWVKQFPELVREIAAAGHEIANHGLYHGHPAQMNRAELVRLLEANQKLLTETIGRQPAKLFAPPSGEYNQQVLSVAGDLGYRTVLWTVDTVDWKRPAPEIIRERVRSKVRPGAIILMHPTAPTVAALRAIIGDLKAKKLQPVPVSQLLSTSTATNEQKAGVTN